MMGMQGYFMCIYRDILEKKLIKTKKKLRLII